MTDDDIVARLRAINPQIPAPHEAADEIERLRAELAAERERAQHWMDKHDKASMRLHKAEAERDELRAKLTMAREAISDARDFTATTLAKIGDGHRIGELVQDWDYALACIDRALKGDGDE